jgi:uncharacterized membrane protein YgaE (UPF0421/DUF939 family)
MARIKSRALASLNRQRLVHSARTAVAATVSLVVARQFRLPEAYWAAITTLIVMQSSLGAALTISWKRFVGTALGAIVAALVTTYFRPTAIAFGGVVFGLGLLCSALHLDRTAYRFASITLAIVMLVVRTKPAWVVATHRFVEVSVGIVVGLVLTAVWPEGESPPAAQAQIQGKATQGESA